ncbi:MAG: DUF134 domain-containing protein [Lachnospiraceae bacterium]|nr:DUF134 domain-containing protein [Lachnospiraceae bacterium]MBR4208810.1 DUF134 domain-containing protein [Lachnospiraceae bacterium]
MARKMKSRRICREPQVSSFAPQGVKEQEQVILTVDEYETIRLVDYEGWTHEQCAAHMDVSRATVTEIYEAARHKLADMLVNGKHLSISGGAYRLCSGAGEKCGKQNTCPAASRCGKCADADGKKENEEQEKHPVTVQSFLKKLQDQERK